jgi:N-acyl-D-aspartate/D-glutamate deacylase
MLMHRTGLPLLLWGLCLSVWTASARSQEPIEADIVLRHGTILDGSTEAPREGDVAVRGDRIVAVGQFEVAGAPHVVDCTGWLVCPGFIDLHNHSDDQIVSPELRANLNSLIQGCTTVVTGNCGGGPVIAAEYYDEIDAHGAGTNVAHLLPQGSLRRRVMGSDNRPPSPDELSEMKKLAEQAMQEGVWGMSTGLIYVPGTYSDTDELVAIAEVVSRHGGIYVSHMRDEGTGLLASVQELLEIGRRASLPVHASHFKASGQEAWGLIRQAAGMLESARQQGQVATADQYPYIASSTSLEATVIPTAARAGGHEELLKRLDDPVQGPAIRSRIEESLRQKQDGAAIRIARYSPHPEWAGRNLRDLAAEQQTTPVDLVIEITRQGGAQIVHFSMSEEDVRFAMPIPWVATASDGRAAMPGADRPHPRHYGTFARKIGYYALREQVLPAEQAVRSASGLPADILGLKDRGYLRPGLAADIVALDPKEYIDRATFDDPHQYAVGARLVLVNGRIAVFNGHPTGALAGRALRHVSTEVSR